MQSDKTVLSSPRVSYVFLPIVENEGRLLLPRLAVVLVEYMQSCTFCQPVDKLLGGRQDEG